MSEYDPFAGAPTDTGGSGPLIVMPENVGQQYWNTYGALPDFSSIGSGYAQMWTQLGQSLLSTLTNVFVAREQRQALLSQSQWELAQQRAGQAVTGALGDSGSLILGAGLAGLAVFLFVNASKKKR